MDTKQAKSLLGIESDYRLAKLLGVTKQAVSKWKCKFDGKVPDHRQEQVREMLSERRTA